ncbi:hypothetical protein [Polaribacter filamentus]|nr:hypothetical protein [Polaribacter filamentus]
MAVFSMLVTNTTSCSSSSDEPESPILVIPDEEQEPEGPTVFDEANSVYKAYTGLVMAGYQGWFSAEGDDSNWGWNHYKNTQYGGFTSSCSSIYM